MAATPELQSGALENDARRRENVASPHTKDYYDEQYRGLQGSVFSGAGESSAEGAARLLGNSALSHSANSGPRAISLKRAQQTHGNQFVQRLVSPVRGTSLAWQLIQRQCSCGACKKCREDGVTLSAGESPTPDSSLKLIQSRAANADGVNAPEVEKKEIIPSDSPGHPLDKQTRDFMESGFGTDFREVLIHTDSRAAASAETLGANAYTNGRDIYFAAGKYTPENDEGKRLLAHELVHTIQQGANIPLFARKRASTSNLIIDPDNSMERNADRVAEQVVLSAPEREMEGDGPHELARTLQPEARNVIHRAPKGDAELEKIEKQLATEVISSEYRAELEQRRAALAERPKFDLTALVLEAERRNEASSAWTSTKEVGPSSVTIPITALISMPEPLDGPSLFGNVVANPDEKQAQELAARYVINQYMQDKLDWPVKVELVDTGNGFWFSFSIFGEDLVASRNLQLPLSALDIVSAESLNTVTNRAAQIVEIAVLEAASSEIVTNIGNQPEKMIQNPEDYPRNQARGLLMLAGRYMERLETLSKSLLPSNKWLLVVLQNRRALFAPVLERVKRADTVTEEFIQANQPPTYAAETYDRVIRESSNRVERFGWKVWRFIGDVATLGGMSAQGENVGMYRRGEISRTDYRKNWVLVIGGVAVKAVVAALTAGRGASFAARFLGLEAGTTAAAVAGGMAEGAATNFAVAFSGDVYAKAVSLFSVSPGVAAFHERIIGGPGSWFESGAWGGIGGGLISWGGSFIPKAPIDPTKSLSRESAFGSAESAVTQLTEADLRIISADLESGEFTIAVRHPVTGELFYASGNVETAIATVRNMTTGEVVGHIRAGKFGPPAPGGALMSGEPVPAESVVAPAETGLTTTTADVPLGPAPEPVPPTVATGEGVFGPSAPVWTLLPGEVAAPELGGPVSATDIVSVMEDIPSATPEVFGAPAPAEVMTTKPRIVKQGSRVLDPKKRIHLAETLKQLKTTEEVERAAIRRSQVDLNTLNDRLKQLKANPKVRPPELDQAFRRLPSMDDIEARLEALEKLKEETGLSSAAKEYLEWQEQILRAEAEILDIKQGTLAAGEMISTRQKVDIPRTEAELRTASKPIKALLRIKGPNYRKMSNIKFDQILGEKRWKALQEKPALETDHLFAVTKIANMPELKEFLEIYAKASDAIKARMIADLIALGDTRDNLVRMRWDANNEKSGKSWEEITYDVAKQYGYEAADVDAMRLSEAFMKEAITKSILELTEKYKRLVSKATK